MANKKINFESEIKEAKKLTFAEKVKKAFDFKTKWQNLKNFDWKRWAKKNLTLNGLGKFAWIVLRAIIIIGLCFMILYPFLVKLVVSFMSVNDITDSTVMFIPREGSLYFVKRAVYNMDFFPALFNTVLLSVLVAIAQLFISCVVGYGFARFKFKGSNVLFFIVILTLIVPSETIILPLYNRFSSWGMLDTIWPITILSICGLGLKNGLYIYLMRQFFRGMPKELEMSAYIDGAGPLRAFWSIMLPNAFNMMITVFLFSFTWQWTDTTYNQMLCPNLNILSNTVRDVAASVTDKVQAAAIEDTATLLVILPLLIVFLFAQRYFIQSIERSGLVE